MIRSHKVAITAFGPILSLGFPCVALAQETIQPDPDNISRSLQPGADGTRQTYTAEQFSRFAPQSALDMVRQIPGFTISRLSNDRGLGDASQNVFVDGRRITGKNNDAETALAAIPVGSVIRLEVGDASAFKVSSLNGQVVNVVTRDGQLRGNLMWRPEYGNGPRPVLSYGEANLAGALGTGKFSLSLTNLRANRDSGEGNEITRGPTGQLINQRRLITHSRSDRPRLAASFGNNWQNGDVMNLNAAIEFFESRRSRTFEQQSSTLVPVSERITNREDEWNIELGADYETNTGRGRLKLIAFHRFENSPYRNVAYRRFADGAMLAERFDQVFDEGESVLRSEYRWAASETDWQVSAEAAYNSLDARSAYFKAVNGGEFEPVAIANATSRVAEKRVQATISYSNSLSSAVSLQALLGAEISWLSQSGPDGLLRRFLRPKGSVGISWTVNPRLAISGRLQRKVGQLSFGDFVASIDLRNGNDNAGNPMLVPPQSWLLEFEAKQSLGDMGSISAKIEAESIVDLVDQIPISPSKEAPGNLQGQSRRWRAEMNATFLLDRFGLSGGKLDLSVALQNAQLTDPLTGRRRTFSRLENSSWKLDFRQDIHDSFWAWGALVEDNNRSPYYRLGFVSKSKRSTLLAAAFVENKNIMGFKLRLSLQNILGSDELEAETFYAARRDGPIATIRKSNTRKDLGYRLQISRSF